VLHENFQQGFHPAVISWEKLFSAVKGYVELFQKNQGEELPFQQRYMVYTPPSLAPLKPLPLHPHLSPEDERIITAAVEDMLSSFLELLRTVVINSNEALIAVSQNSNWMALQALLQLLCCRIAYKVKAAVLRAIDGLCLAPDAASQTWEFLCRSEELLSAKIHGDELKIESRGLKADLAVEQQACTYPETRAFVGLLRTLVPYMHEVDPEKARIRVYITYLLNDLLHPLLQSLPFQEQSMHEKWELAGDILSVLCVMIINYVPADADFVAQHRPSQHQQQQMGDGSSFVSGYGRTASLALGGMSTLGLAGRDGQAPGAKPSGASKGVARFAHLEGPRFAGLLVLLDLLGDSQKSTLYVLASIVRQQRRPETLQLPSSSAHLKALRNCVHLSMAIFLAVFERQRRLLTENLVTDRIESFLLRSFESATPAPLVVDVFHMLGADAGEAEALMALKFLFHISQVPHTPPTLRGILHNQPAAVVNKVRVAVGASTTALH
jgi:hypothetical protein